MVESICGRCAKGLLFIFNFFFWLSGGALLGVGIWLLQDQTIVQHLEVIAKETNEADLRIATYVMIGTGGFVFLIGFCGCCGASQESRCLLWLYSTFMFLVIAAEVGAAIAVFFFKNKVEAFFHESLKDELQDNYLPNTTLRDAWDTLQRQFKCCGTLGPFEWRETAWFRSQEAQPEGVQKLYAPWSCCRTASLIDGKGEICQDEARGNNTPSEHLYVTGCFDSLLDWVTRNAQIIIIVGASIAALQVLGLVFSCLLIYEVRQEKSVGTIA